MRIQGSSFDGAAWGLKRAHLVGALFSRMGNISWVRMGRLTCRFLMTRVNMLRKTLASGSADKSAKLWDVATGNEIRTLKGHTGSVDSMAYSPDGNTIASSGFDGSLRFHRVEDGVEMIALRALAQKNAYDAFTPSGHIDLVGPDACSARQYPICRRSTPMTRATANRKTRPR